LRVFVEKIDEIWEKDFHKEISRADFWQLASHVALIRGGLNRKCSSKDHKECTFFDIPFWWGRKDCNTSPHHDHSDDTGNGHGDFHECKRILHGDFGLKDYEIVAILGVHSLGGAHKSGGSGFDYNWQKEHTIFDNRYFKNMIGLNYAHENVTEDVLPDETIPHDKPPRIEFVFTPTSIDEKPLLMLNTDIALWKEIHAEKDKHGHYTGEVTCPLEKHHKEVQINEDLDLVTKCKDAKTAQYVYKFAHHLDEFFDVFADSWKAIITNGYKHLPLVGAPHEHKKCGYCIPHGAFCKEGFEKSGQCCPGSHCKDNKCV